MAQSPTLLPNDRWDILVPAKDLHYCTILIGGSGQTPPPPSNISSTHTDSHKQHTLLPPLYFPHKRGRETWSTHLGTHRGNCQVIARYTQRSAAPAQGSAFVPDSLPSTAGWPPCLGSDLSPFALAQQIDTYHSAHTHPLRPRIQPMFAICRPLSLEMPHNRYRYQYQCQCPRWGKCRDMVENKACYQPARHPAWLFYKLSTTE